MRTPMLIALGMVLALTGCAATGSHGPHVEMGACTLVAPRQAGPAEMLAQEELAASLLRMQPKRFVVRSASGTAEYPRILACRYDAPELALVDPPIAEPQGDGYVIAVRGSWIYLVGGEDRAVLYAAYDFLHRLGCRWLAPAFGFYNGFHDVVPQGDELVFELLRDVHEQPVMTYRKLYVEEGHSHNEENLRQLVAWMPKLRFNTLVIPIDYSGRGRVKWDTWRAALTPELQRRGIIIEVGGHGYQNFLNAEMDDGRWFREHPEWFGVDEKGERTRARNRVLCTSNPEAVAFLQRNVLAYLREHPEIEIFDFWPPDGARWCACDACKKLGTPSQRHVKLVSDMAAMLRTAMPNVRLECIAYSSYVEPAEGVRLDPGVLVDFCPIAQCFEKQIYEPGPSSNETYKSALYAWRETFRGPISIYSYYRKYAWCSLPNLIPHYMQNDLRFYRDVGVCGISSYAEPGDWATYEVNHYVLGHLAWNPDADVNAVLDEFLAARYGPESKTARAVVDTLEAVVRHGCTIPHTSGKTVEQYAAYAAKIEQSRQSVAAAIIRCGDQPAVRAALKRLGLMLEYAARDIAIARQIAGGGSIDERQALVDDLIAFLKRHRDDGVFCWHQRLEAPRQYRKYKIPRERLPAKRTGGSS